MTSANSSSSSSSSSESSESSCVVSNQKEEERKEKEVDSMRELQEEMKATQEKLEKEIEEKKPELVFTIKNSLGGVVKKIYQPVKKGYNRISWNLRYESKNPISMGFSKSNYNSKGTLVSPGIEVAIHSRPIADSFQALVSGAWSSMRFQEGTMAELISPSSPSHSLPIHRFC